MLKTQDEQVCTLGNDPKTEEGEEQHVLPLRRWWVTGQLASFLIVVKLSSLTLVMPTQLPQDGRVQNEGVVQKHPEMLPKLERMEQQSRSL